MAGRFIANAEVVLLLGPPVFALTGEWSLNRTGFVGSSNP
jgi:hypothetical protein